MASLKDLRALVEAQKAVAPTPTLTAAQLWEQKRKEGMSADEATAYVSKHFGPPPAKEPERGESFGATRRLMLREIGNAIARARDSEEKLQDALKFATESALTHNDMTEIDYRLRTAITKVDFCKNAIKRARNTLAQLGSLPIPTMAKPR